MMGRSTAVLGSNETVDAPRAKRRRFIVMIVVVAARQRGANGDTLLDEARANHPSRFRYLAS